MRAQAWVHAQLVAALVFQQFLVLTNYQLSN
jgi:hypothetical protein